MDCTQCREALSARLDGEESESAAERDAIDAHLTTCAACRRFADQAARVTRLARTGVATQEPDVVEAVLAAAPRARRPRLVTALRVLLGLVGLAQVEIAFVGVLTAAHGSQGVVLDGASVTHFAHESAAWNLALGVGFLWIAWRSSRASAMVPTLVTFVAVLAVLVVLDVVAERVEPERFVVHGLVVLGLILVIGLDRLPRPTGDAVPGVPAWGPSRPADPARGTDADGLPPDLRPTAQHDGTAIARRRIA
ncbi:MAG: zf-HC2 domain-containing protein [Pseudonocardiaceae bacterium]